MYKILLGLLPVLLLSCKNDENNNDNPGQPPPKVPATFNCIPVKTFPHDTSYFTEGFLVYNGSLYESTGNYGESKLVKVNMNTWKPEKEIDLDKKYFGEGLTILRDTIYQLTYQEHAVFVYTLDFKKIKELYFDNDNHQGWGMTTDGTHLIASDGTSNLYYYDPATFKILKKITVTDSGTPGYNVNELEWIDGYIYANQWQLPYILKIDPSTGEVVAKADLTDIANKIKQRNPNADVLNGIAYDPSTKKIYITGKRWPDTYEVLFQ
jgi:glutaminyl-peptide cyclotransferase